MESNKGETILSLFKGTPEIREHYINSKKDVDRHLKSACEQFIQQQTKQFVEPLEEFLSKVLKYCMPSIGVLNCRIICVFYPSGSSSLRTQEVFPNPRTECGNLALCYSLVLNSLGVTRKELVFPVRT